MHIVRNIKFYKRFKIIFIGVLFASMSSFVYAEENSTPTLFFEMSIEGKDTKEVSYGDIINVDLKLKRTDVSDQYIMYAMQDEIRYDSEFFELVEDEIDISDTLFSTDIANTDNFREFYINFLSMSGGAQWDSSTKLATIRFKVIGKSGVSKISSQDYLVSLKDGTGSYPCEANDVTVVVSTECTVKFESRGGSQISDIIVQYGEKLNPPIDPIRDGYTFAGWYSDIDLRNKWDFENNKVLGNMTLYADWSETVQSSDVKYNNIWWIIVLFFVLVIVLIFYHRYGNKKKKM